MAEWIDGLAAKCPFLAFMPFRDNAPDQTIRRVRLNLLQALAAILPFRPLRALASRSVGSLKKVPNAASLAATSTAVVSVLPTGDHSFPARAENTSAH